MRYITALILALSSCTIGCNNVVVDVPFGDPVALSTIESFRGIWFDTQANVYFVEPGAKSDLVVGFTRWNPDANVFETQSVPMSVRKVNNRTFLFVPQDINKNDKLVFVWLSEMEDGVVYFRNCDADAFRKVVSSGTLAGTVNRRKNDHFDVHLESSERLEELLASPNGADLFYGQGEDPLRRLTPQTDGSDVKDAVN